MADLKKRLKTNVAGEFFVDSTCINCDTCRQLAPETFEDSGEHSFVFKQPLTGEQKYKATQALLSCPTGSIGTEHHNNAREVMQSLPMLIENNIYYVGFNSPKSFGGNSYFIKHADGNWLIDSPKFLPHLVKRFEELGGIKYIFLTHRDDVAECSKYAQYFGSQRIIHVLDLTAQPDAEIVIAGIDPIYQHPDFLIIPTSGHTQGHCVLLYENKYLFSGDHLWWSRSQKHLAASQRVCWYSWTEQTKSMAKLKDYQFEWVLPGHGQRIHLDANTVQRNLAELVETMSAS